MGVSTLEYNISALSLLKDYLWRL